MNIEFISSISEIKAEQWNQLTGTDYPFLRHEFLMALEQSGVVSRKTGWQPEHLLVYAEAELVAVCPLYFKYHSQGEFVFDQQWANAYQQHSLDYYPKALTAVPFTPCQAQRILFKKGIDEAAVLGGLVTALKQQLIALKLSSWHCLFSSPSQIEQLSSLGLMVREGVQFQWFNQHYRDFQDFTDAFTSRKRKNTYRERQQVREQGIEFLTLAGQQVSETQWQVFFQFYQMTYLKHGMPGYLNLDFFKQIAQSMPEQVLLIFALKANRYIGAALSFIGADTLYGRYWGCFEEYHFLHFEACYYQGLDYCIAQGLKRFDSGAQGEHKIARGFAPVTTYSAHWIQHPEFAKAIADFIRREKAAVQQYKADATAMLPFKKI
ncbi:MAG: N-acetyltransferase [Methylococcaceae bacterium]|nr:N-acetyltransferase [Methylococcaceae bacterium]